MVKLNLLCELVPRHYQLPQMTMKNIVENWVDCWMEAQNTTKLVLVYHGGKEPKMPIKCDSSHYKNNWETKEKQKQSSGKNNHIIQLFERIEFNFC